MTARPPLALICAAALPAAPAFAQDVPTPAEVLAAEIEASDMASFDVHAVRLRFLQPEVTALRCNVVAPRRASCRYRWHAVRGQRRWTMYGAYVRRPDGRWSQYPVPVDMRRAPIIQPPSTN
jgi:hypothetical protein